MKNFKLLIAAGLLAFSFNASASSEDPVLDYGIVDTLVTGNHPNLTEIFEKDIGVNDLFSLGTGLYAYKFGKDEIPDYFKIGGDGFGGSDDVYKLFKNEDKLLYGVFGTAKWDTDHPSTPYGDNCHSFKPEHIIGYSVVPVPAAVWLFATGLIGLVAVARRKV